MLIHILYLVYILYYSQYLLSILNNYWSPIGGDMPHGVFSLYSKILTHSKSNSQKTWNHNNY